MSLVLPASTRHTQLLQTKRKLDMTTQKKSAPAVAFQSNHDVAIHVPDLKIAENFYAGVLGFHLVSKSEGQLHFDTGTLHLWVNQDATPKQCAGFRFCRTPSEGCRVQNGDFRFGDLFQRSLWIYLRCNRGLMGGGDARGRHMFTPDERHPRH